VNIFEHFWLDFLGLGFDGRNLAANHALMVRGRWQTSLTNSHALCGGDWLWR